MSKPYWSGAGRGSASRFADDPPAYQHDPFEPPTENFGRVHDYPDHADGDYDYYGDHDGDYDGYRDTRWRWIAGIAGIVLAVALVAIAVASHGGDTATRSVTPVPSSAPEQDAVSTTPRTVIATVPPSAPTPTAALPPETVVTVTTTPSAADQPAVEPPAAVPAPPPAATPPAQTITYTVTGTRQLFDLVSIIYTDEQGFPRTDVNVALPWTRTIVLNPGVVTKSVTATSLTGQLNCAVTDGSGVTLAVQTNNAAIASCTQ